MRMVSKRPANSPVRAQYLSGLKPRAFALALSAIAALFLFAACIDSEPARETATVVAGAQAHIVMDPEPGHTALRCEDCEPASVVRVLNFDTVLTERGPFRLYGAFVAPESESCIAASAARLEELVGATVRLEQGTRLLDGQGASVRYIYTEAGDSIDEFLISEGTARLSSFDGPHMPWLLFQADIARIERRGCVWEEYNQLFGRD